MSSSSSSSIQQSPSSLLCALYVFRNILNQELIRSVHVYRATEENREEEKEWLVEREFLFSPTSCLEIRAPAPRLLLLEPKEKAKYREGQVVSLWHCILAFNSSAGPLASSVPHILSFSRNPRLRSVPALSDDLQKVFALQCRPENKVLLQSTTESTHSENEDEASNSRGLMAPYYQDQLSHFSANIQQQLSDDQQYNYKISDGELADMGPSSKNKRAATKHVASIALTDLAKYFNLPIAEASRNLKVGLTVLKRKCREFGIPRWPHRKIKSLDTLIHNLQEEVTRQEREDKAAAVKAVLKRQRMLQSEKEGIERRPFMEIQGETKRFRQDVFKRRHRAKAQSKKCLCPSIEDGEGHLLY